MGSRSRNGRETFTAAPPAGADQDKGAEQSDWNRGWEARAEAAGGGGGRGGATQALAPPPPAGSAPHVGRGRGGTERGGEGRGPAREGRGRREGARPRRVGAGVDLGVFGCSPRL